MKHSHRNIFCRQKIGVFLQRKNKNLSVVWTSGDAAGTGRKVGFLSRDGKGDCVNKRNRALKQTFISFVHEDACIATPLAAFLEKNGHKVFLTADEWTLYAGEVWLDRIKKELGGADIVLALFSRSSVTRPWIHFEAGAAWLSGKLMIPVCIGSFGVEDLRIPYSGIQSVHLSDYGSVYYLLRSMHRHRAGSEATMVPPVSPATDEIKSLLEALSSYKDLA